MDFMVDIEADGPAPGLYSMVSFGVVEMTSSGWGRTFYGQLAPITDAYIPEALAVSKHTREEHLAFEDPKVVMTRLDAWVRDITENRRAHFFSDNPAFDWQFINYYLHRYVGDNIFGHSARRIGDIYAGAVRDFHTKPTWKKWKKPSIRIILWTMQKATRKLTPKWFGAFIDVESYKDLLAMTMHHIHFVSSSHVLASRLQEFFPEEMQWSEFLGHLHSYCRVHEVAHTELLSMLLQPLNWLDMHDSHRYWSVVQQFYAKRSDSKKFQAVLQRFERGDPTLWGYGVRSLSVQSQTARVLDFVLDRFKIDPVALSVTKFIKMQDTTTQEWLQWSGWFVAHLLRSVEDGTYNQDRWRGMLCSMPLAHQIAFVSSIYSLYHTQWKTLAVHSPLSECICFLVKEWQRHDATEVCTIIKTMLDCIDDSASYTLSLQMPTLSNVRLDPETWTSSDRWVWKAFVVRTMLSSFTEEQRAAWTALEVSRLTLCFLPIEERVLDTPDKVNGAIWSFVRDSLSSNAAAEHIRGSMAVMQWPVIENIAEDAISPHVADKLRALFLDKRCVVRWLTTILQREVGGLHAKIKDREFLQGVALLRYLADQDHFSEPYNPSLLFVALAKRLDVDCSVDHYKQLVAVVKQTGSADVVPGLVQQWYSEKAVVQNMTFPDLTSSF